MAANTSNRLRRTLRFSTVDDALKELSSIEVAHRSGSLRSTGNWTPGQIFSHVSSWIEYAYIGYPVKPLPRVVQWIMRTIMLPRILRDGMKPGVKIPGVRGGTTGAEMVETDQGIEILRQSFHRLASGESARFHSPAFGKISDDDRVALMLRHAELHMSFLATGQDKTT